MSLRLQIQTTGIKGSATEAVASNFGSNCVQAAGVLPGDSILVRYPDFQDHRLFLKQQRRQSFYQARAAAASPAQSTER
jgi:hypothetical protein